MIPTIEELKAKYGEDDFIIKENRQCLVPLWAQHALIPVAPKKKRHYKKLLKKRFLEALKKGMSNEQKNIEC